MVWSRRVPPLLLCLTVQHILRSHHGTHGDDWVEPAQERACNDPWDERKPAAAESDGEGDTDDDTQGQFWPRTAREQGTAPPQPHDEPDDKADGLVDSDSDSDEEGMMQSVRTRTYKRLRRATSL